MLKYRVITALILIPLFVILVLKLPPVWFCILTGLVVLWGAWEWSFFLGIQKRWGSFLYLFLMIVALLIALELPIVNVLYVSLAWWLLALLLVLIYPKGSHLWGRSVILRALMGMFVLIPCWLAINLIRNADDGVYILLFLFILIWNADISAYFVGRKWGKHKLLPEVSPGKSWQGLLGALCATSILAILVLAAFQVPYSMWPFAILLSLITVLFSVLGDLFESMLKRNVGLKDSGRLLPGHGGLLDRIDSLTAASPVFALGALALWKFFQ